MKTERLEERMRKAKEAIRRRQEEGYNRKDDSGMFKTIYKPEIRREHFFKCTEGEHSGDFIPYIAGKFDPFTKEGEETYCCDLWVHTNVGPNRDSYICLERNYKKPCSECDYLAELRSLPPSEQDAEKIKSISPTRRVIYNFHCLDTSQTAAMGVLLFEVSHFLFEKVLQESAKKKGGLKIYFADPTEEGKTVTFVRKGMGLLNTSFVPFTFEDRGKPISESILKQARCIDELLHIPTYEEVYEARFGRTKSEQVEKVEDSSDEVPSFSPDECPLGQSFGEDFNAFEECSDCVNFESCEAKFEELKAKKEAEETARREALRRRPQTKTPTPRRVV